MSCAAAVWAQELDLMGPVILERLNPAVVEAEVGLVVHALQALHHGLLHLVDDLAALAGLRVDAVDAFVVDLDFEIL